ncbi:MAG: M48 family metallopeptidase [Proteobacteria bacterium]|nr:M48 family metallopeptidase [Pseudomonadota bacterium]
MKVDKIIKSKRKTIALQLNSDGLLIVRAPNFATKEQIESFIKKHYDWLVKVRQDLEEKQRRIKKANFVEGENFLFLGNYYRLELKDNQKEPLIFDNAFCLKRSLLPSAREFFLLWYKKEAKKIITERLEYYSKITGLKFNSVKINSAKKRWGSCSGKNDLNFSFRLILTSLGCVDYVVVHELVHTIIKDHSKNFWTKVKEIYPDYKIYRKFLREEGSIISKFI